jgi:hypothetical protein
MTERPLPDQIMGYLGRILTDDAVTPTRVRLTQTGEMVQKPGGRRLEFRATQEYGVGTVEFEWRATFGPNPLVRVKVVDRLRAGEGHLVARVWGLIPATRSAGPATDRGEVMRYLAELPWVPYAIRSNPQLSWRELEDGSVEVSAPSGGGVASVVLTFDDAGLIRRASAMRPRLVGGTAVDTPWVGVFGDYVELGGISVPGGAEVSWELPEGPFTYWRGEVASLVAE